MSDIVNGIVLDSFNYKETSIIVRVYTRQQGIVSILINGVRKRNPKFSLAYFQSLCRIDFQLYYKSTSSLHRADGFYFPGSGQWPINDVKKSAIAIFISEVVWRTTKEKEIDERLFELLEHIILLLDSPIEGFQDLHLYFLYFYSSILGFSLEHFGGFANDTMVKNSISQHLKKMRQWSVEGYHPLEVPRTEKSSLLKEMLRYFEEHHGFFTVKSLKVLEDVFQR